MSNEETKMAWIERVEELVHALDGSSIGELELSENGIEIVIRRQPEMVLVSAPPAGHTTSASAAGPRRRAQSGGSGRTARENQTIPILAPLSGVYYSAPSPSSPPFVSVGDVIQVGQVIALIEAMKVFNEIQAEAAGRVTRILVESGTVVQKGDVLLRVEPL
jgi:acetyl-CoA carboxylase biotin carboxyl carrier protein